MECQCHMGLSLINNLFQYIPSALNHFVPVFLIYAQSDFHSELVAVYDD